MQYVGKSELRLLARRWRQHRADSKRRLPRCYIHRALKYYKVENFSFEVVQRCHTFDTLNAAECRWIKRLNTFAPNGYNMTLGGDGVHGLVHSRESRRKMKAARLQFLADEEKWPTLAAMVYTPAFAEKARMAAHRQYADSTKREKHAAAGRTARSRRKCAKSQRFRYDNATPEQRATWTVAIRKGMDSPEYHENLVAGQRRFWGSMTAEERSAYWRKIHPNNNGGTSERTKAFWGTMTPEERKAYWHKIHPKK